MKHDQKFYENYFTCAGSALRKAVLMFKIKKGDNLPYHAVIPAMVIRIAILGNFLDIDGRPDFNKLAVKVGFFGNCPCLIEKDQIFKILQFVLGKPHGFGNFDRPCRRRMTPQINRQANIRSDRVTNR